MPCTLMSMMSESLLPSACEVDITGLLSMYILQLAGESPAHFWIGTTITATIRTSAWCSIAAISPNRSSISPRMDFNEIIGSVLGKDRSWGTVGGTIKKGSATFCRMATDDVEGKIRGYVGEGDFTDDPLDTFGGVGVLAVPRLQQLLQFICLEGFEHHVATCFSQTASAVHEALTRYLGWDVHHHQ